MNKAVNFSDDIYPVDLAKAPKLNVFTQRQLAKIPQFMALPETARKGVEVAALVFPFRVNEYVVNELIDWDSWQDCAIFRLTFPQKEMLSDADFRALEQAYDAADKAAIKEHVERIREGLNPHPAGQMELNVPTFNGEPVEGIQHKYNQTVLFFPTQGQTCHSYCTFCFRWAQFVGDKDLKFASKEVSQLVGYLSEHKEVTDILFTGGDPMVMKTKALANYLEAMLTPELEHIKTIRIGTKALTFWPYRFVSDDDADELIDLLERCVAAGKHVAIMAHYNHWKELTTDISRAAIARIRATGAEIRSQGPLLKGINDDPEVWAKMWQMQVAQGIIPYYMFVERDTGAHHYFEVKLERAWTIYREAQKQVSGVCRTARGPSMSASPGKVEVQGITEVNGEKVMVLRFIQGRDPDWVQRPFFAKYNPDATWLDHLEPAFGEAEFFFES
ncbi:MAG: 4Fe-4S cluster-binding domain-containing protein [Gammaproteobacteria bacterium]|nr:4Fe-4S cluster-binding domain-containing protein [Gammaproteobacteria bacterium]NVK88913.1 4Fe-4S cluster-binding domain-containing protein [Gammaproteobacteria bacterium]